MSMIKNRQIIVLNIGDIITFSIFGGSLVIAFEMLVNRLFDKCMKRNDFESLKRSRGKMVSKLIERFNEDMFDKPSNRTAGNLVSLFRDKSIVVIFTELSNRSLGRTARLHSTVTVLSCDLSLKSPRGSEFISYKNCLSCCFPKRALLPTLESGFHP